MLLLVAQAAAKTGRPEIPFAPAEVLVCWEPGRAKANTSPGAEDLARRYGLVSEAPLWPAASGRAKPTPQGPALGSWSRLTFAPDVDPGALAAAYAGLKEVRWAQPNYLRAEASVPDDSLLGQQWSLPAMGWGWDAWPAAEEVVVAIVDSGVDRLHPDLVGQFWLNPVEAAGQPGVDDDGNGYVDDLRGWDFSDAPGMPGEGDFLDRDADPDDESGHGTHVAGIVAAIPNNHIGIAGVAPAARLMALRAGFNIGGGGFLQDDDVAAAIVYAADQGAGVINMSFGDPNFSPLIRDVVGYAAQAGCVLVAAAGNESNGAVFYPARLPEVIAVGATGRENRVLAFSNHGYSLDLAAPGLAILSLLPGGAYGERSGTSMAAAQVSGLAAAVLGRHPEFSPAQVKGALVQTAVEVGEPGWDPRAGGGLAQLAARQVDRPSTLQLQVEKVEEDRLRIVLAATGEGAFDVAWASGAGEGPWTELIQGVVSGQLGQGLGWPPAGLADGTYLLRARLHTGGWVWEEQIALDLSRAPGRASGLELHRALDGERWAQIAQWQSQGTAPDTLLVYVEDTSELRYEIVDHTGSSKRWLRLPDDLGPGRYRARIGMAGPEVSFAVESDPVHRWGLEARGTLPEGYLLPTFADYNGNGLRELVAMRVQGNRYNPVDYYEGGEPTPAHTSSLLFVPWAETDLDGDGLGEVVGVDAQRVRLIEAATSGAYPSASVWQQADAWGGEVADLDGDGRPELLLRSVRAAIFQVFEGRGNNDLRETAVLANPTAGDNEAGERQVAADLDGDGRGELLAGDADGDLWIHEAIGDDAYRLTWQEHGALPDGDARLVGGGVDLDGDGRREFVVGRLHQDPYDLRQTRWSVEVYEARGDNDFVLEWELEALGGKAGGNGINLADWDGDGQIDVALALPPHLYILTAEGIDRYRPVWQGAAGEVHRPAAGDLDGDGRADLAYNTGQGIAILSTHTGLPPPVGFKVRPLDADRVALEWNRVPGATSYRIYRDGTPLPATTGTPAYEDRALAAGVEYRYRVSARAGEEESALSAEVRVRPQPPPRVEGIERMGAHQLAVGFDRPMAEAAAYRMRVEPRIGMPSSVVLDRSGRRMVLGFARVLPDSGQFSLELRGVQDAAGGPLAPIPVAFALRPWIAATRVTGATVVDPGRVAVQFSAPIAGARPAAFAIMGGRHQVAAVQVSGLEVFLQIEPPLRPIGERYLVQIAGVVSAAGETVAGRVALELAALDLSRAAFFPNPFRSSSGRATFGFLPPRAEIRIFDLQGRLQQVLTEEDGDGGVYWDGRGADGERLPSGVYLFRIQSGNAEKLGKLALVRD